MNNAYGHIDKDKSTLRCPRLVVRVWHGWTFYTQLSRLKDIFGVTGKAREWISQFVYTVRSRRIRIECSHYCSCGVPQGSVLGPMFLVACTSPIAKDQWEIQCAAQSYADDTQLYVALSKMLMTVAVGKLSNCRSHVVHSEWTSYQPREIEGGPFVDWNLWLTVHIVVNKDERIKNPTNQSILQNNTNCISIAKLKMTQINTRYIYHLFRQNPNTGIIFSFLVEVW